MPTKTRVQSDPLMLAIACRVLAVSDRPMSLATRYALTEISRQLCLGEFLSEAELMAAAYGYFAHQSDDALGLVA